MVAFALQAKYRRFNFLKVTFIVGLLAIFGQAATAGNSRSLDEKYGNRMLPTSVSQVFLEGRDVPTSALPLGSREDKKSTATNSMLSDLNLEAGKIWLKMEKCVGGDSEAARKSYYLDNWSCTDANELRAEVRDLKRNIENFFVTVFFKFSFHSTDEISFGVETLHPLFVQTLWEQISCYFLLEEPSLIGRTISFFKIRPAYDQDQFHSKTDREEFLKKILQILFAYGTHSCEELGLWPGLNRLVAYYANQNTSPVFKEEFSMLIFYPERGLNDKCGQLENSGFPVSIYDFHYSGTPGVLRADGYLKYGHEAILEYAKMYGR